MIKLNITKGVWGTGPQEQGQKRKLKNKKINFTNQDKRSKVELVKLQIKGMPTYTSQKITLKLGFNYIFKLVVGSSFDELEIAYRNFF